MASLLSKYEKLVDTGIEKIKTWRVASTHGSGSVTERSYQSMGLFGSATTLILFITLFGCWLLFCGALPFGFSWLGTSVFSGGLEPKIELIYYLNSLISTVVGSGVFVSTSIFAALVLIFGGSFIAGSGPYSLLITIGFIQFWGESAVEALVSFFQVMGASSVATPSEFNQAAGFSEYILGNSPVGILSAFGINGLTGALTYQWFLPLLGLGFVVLFLVSGIFLATRSVSGRWFWRNRVLDQVALSTLALTFSILLIGSNNFLLMFLTWVGLNLSLYGLLAQFSFSLKAQEAAIKYFVLGLVSAGFFLFGIWLVYLSFGSVDFSFVLSAVGASVGLSGIPVLAIWGSILIIFVLFFKLSAFPFQAWALDVYEGASWFSLAVLVLLVKPVFIVLLIKVLNCFGGFSSVLSPLVFTSGVTSMVIGTVGAGFQQKIKRFLAMSSISHMGFILMLLGLEFANSTIALNYLLAYILANFIVLAVVSGARVAGPTHPTSRSLVYCSELVYLNGTTVFRSPFTLPLSIALLSLAGLPPFFGFFAKLSFFLTCCSTATVASLVGFGLALLLMPLSVFNYLRLIRLLWVGDCSVTQQLFFVNIVSERFFTYVITAVAFVISLGGLFLI